MKCPALIRGLSNHQQVAAAVRGAGGGKEEKFATGMAAVEDLWKEARALLYTERYTCATEARFAMDNDIFFPRRAAKSAWAENVSLVSNQGALFENVLLDSRIFRKNANRGAELGPRWRDFVTYRSRSSALNRAGNR